MKKTNKPFCYVKDESVYIYQFCKKVRRQNATIIQLWSNFFANKAIYGVKDLWRLLLITNNRKEWEKLLFGEIRVFLRLQTLIIALTWQSSLKLITQQFH